MYPHTFFIRHPSSQTSTLPIKNIPENDTLQFSQSGCLLGSGQIWHLVLTFFCKKSNMCPYTFFFIRHPSSQTSTLPVYLLHVLEFKQVRFIGSKRNVKYDKHTLDNDYYRYNGISRVNVEFLNVLQLSGTNWS